jgi:hypothetical protein
VANKKYESDQDPSRPLPDLWVLTSALTIVRQVLEDSPLLLVRGGIARSGHWVADGLTLTCRRWDSQFDSIMNIQEDALHILVMLSLGAMLFPAAMQRLVLFPIGRMVQRVKALWPENPCRGACLPFV